MTQRAIIATHARHNCAYFWLQPRRDVQDARGTTMSRRRPFFVPAREEVAAKKALRKTA